MRRIVSVILVMIMTIGLIACGGKSEKADNTNVTNQSSQEKTIDKEDAGAQEKTEGSDMKTHTVYTAEGNFSIDYPTKLVLNKNGAGDVFSHISDDYYIAWGVDRFKENKTFEDLIGVLGMTLMSRIDGRTTNELRDTVKDTGGITVTSSKKVMIANMDALQFTATVKNCIDKGDPVYDCHVYGYSFMLNGCPSLLLGIVDKPEQSAEAIKEMNSRVDVMMSTIRTIK